MSGWFDTIWADELPSRAVTVYMYPVSYTHLDVYKRQDTKGVLARNYAGIAKDIYGYDVSVLDLRNPACSDGNNLLDLVNKYMDCLLYTSRCV